MKTQTKTPILIKNLRKEKNFDNFFGYNNKISNICKISEGTFICGSTQGSIAIANYDYKYRDFSILNLQQKAHNYKISSISFNMYDNNLITGSEDGTVKIWKYKQSNLDFLFTLKDNNTKIEGSHSENITKVLALRNGNILTCSYYDSHDSIMKLWDINTKKVIFKFSSDNYSALSAIEIPSKNIIFASIDNNATGYVCYFESTNISSYMNIYECFSLLTNCLCLLPNDNVAILKENEMEIIKPELYEIIPIKKIESRNINSNNLDFAFPIPENKQVFVFVSNGNLIQINLHNYKILNEIVIKNELEGKGDVFLHNDSYILADNSKLGINLFEIA